MSPGWNTISACQALSCSSSHMPASWSSASRVQRGSPLNSPCTGPGASSSFSSACDLTGTLLTQFLGAPIALNPLAHASWWSPALAAWLADSAGVHRRDTAAFLAAGLFQVLRVYRTSGNARLTVPDWSPCSRPPGRMSFARPPISSTLFASANVPRRSPRLAHRPAPGSSWPRKYSDLPIRPPDGARLDRPLLSL